MLANLFTLSGRENVKSGTPRGHVMGVRSTDDLTILVVDFDPLKFVTVHGGLGAVNIGSWIIVRVVLSRTVFTFHVVPAVCVKADVIMSPTLVK